MLQGLDHIHMEIVPFMLQLVEIIRILTPLTDDPNGPNSNGVTPMFLAAQYGHLEIVRFLKGIIFQIQEKRKLQD